MTSNYDKSPVNQITGYNDHCQQGWIDIRKEIEAGIKRTNSSKIVIECYTGLFDEEIKQNLEQIANCKLVDVSQAYKTTAEIEKMTYPDVTDDRVFGRLTELSILDCFDTNKLSDLKTSLQNEEQPVILYGTGAFLVAEEWDTLIYADMARWEIQLRMRANLVNNLGVENKEEAFAAKYKRAFFVDWRLCDRIKIDLLSKLDYLLDTNARDIPKLLSGEALRAGLNIVANQPFRVVPFFDPGPWGGQWMREVCDLDDEPDNFAWCFDCVPEENSLLLGFGDKIVEIPSLDLIFYKPNEVLGKEVYEILGPEFPIRFDFLDTMDGGNLSLQVHPSVKYIREQFGMTYTQDESYYMLDVEDGAVVYLGLKEDVNPDEMLAELEAAQAGDQPFDADKHVQKWEVKKHDHVLIPAGTVHCSGRGSMVLEISATPYIFTFKLWDWGRMGLDGRPRPIHIEHGKKVIEWDRTAEWTKKNLVNQVELVNETDHSREEITGLHEFEFIKTHRHWFTGKVYHDTQGLVNVLNLVEGREAIVESPTNAFEPFVVHYIETFIIPASVGEYTIRPYGESEGQECATIKAYVKTETLRQFGDDLWMMKKPQHVEEKGFYQENGSSK